LRLTGGLVILSDDCVEIVELRRGYRKSFPGVLFRIDKYQPEEYCSRPRAVIVKKVEPAYSWIDIFEGIDSPG
jgi:hypothetical protein